jgi:hypothetical protein
MTAVAKKKVDKTSGSRQLAFRVPEALAQRVERVAERLGLDTSNFLRMLLLEQVGVYERRADRIEAGEEGGGEG